MIDSNKTCVGWHRRSHARAAHVTLSAAQALESEATHFAFLQHSMALLQPLPLLGLPCMLTAYQTIPTAHFMSSEAKSFVLKHWVEPRS